jgi:hypothetical protein
MEELRALSLSVISAGDRWKGLLLGKQLIALRKGGLPLDGRTVAEFARPELAVSPGDSIEAASRLMSEHRLFRLPVVENERVVGSLNEADARSWLGLAAKPDPGALARLSRWRPPRMTARQRGQPNGPQVERWERLLRAEHSATYHLVSVAARSGLLRSLLGLPERLTTPPGAALGEREARVAEVRNTPLARLISALPAGRRKDGLEGAPPPRPDRRPAVGPLLDAELDAALSLVTSMAFEELQERGWNLQPNHYNWPLNDLRFLRENPQLWVRQDRLHGIDPDLDGQERLATRLAVYAEELDDVRDGPSGKAGEFVWENGSFPRADAYAYYGLIRELRPRRVFEVGAGSSSLVLARAVRANAQPCEVTLIEPEPRWHVLGENPDGWRILPSLLQHVDLAHFDALQAGDVLFYDGSHSVHTASDVNWMMFEVLPRLAPGVWIHFHDINWPFDYPPGWTLDEGFSWNEQYLLQGFLMHNSAYRLRLAMTMLLARRSRRVQSLFPGELVGGSVWLEKVSD